MNFNNIQQLQKLIREGVIKEIGDLNNIETYSYGSSKEKAFFTTSTGDYISVWIKPINMLDSQAVKIDLPDSFDKTGTVYNISFTVNDREDQSKKTSYSELIKILATVFTAANDMAKTYYDDNSIFIMAAFSKLGAIKDDSQKLMLYKAILTNNITDKYRMTNIKYEGFNFIAIQKTI